MNRGRPFVVVLLVLALAALGWWYADTRAPHRHEPEPRVDAAGNVYYTCPMHPEVQKDAPGQCPICGMQLVRRERRPEPADAGTASVQIDPRAMQNFGIRTAPVERGVLARQVDAVGAVEVDERRIVVVESRAAGWIERLELRAVGDPVRRGQTLAAIYAPELFAAQEELALAAKSGDAALIAASRQRLLLLGASEAQIESVLRTGRAERQLRIAAPAPGIVTELNVRQGQQVAPGTPLLRIADLSSVWINVEIPETQGAWIAEGRSAEARLAALPGRVFEGQVEYLYPQLDAQTRTLRARLSFANPELVLKPGMFAAVALFGGPRADTLLVPSEAVIRTGTRTAVILAEPGGRFRPALVTVGDERAGETEILSGLAQGETVVVSGQFLIDSEASLQGVLGRMAPPRQGVPGAAATGDDGREDPAP